MILSLSESIRPNVRCSCFEEMNNKRERSSSATGSSNPKRRFRDQEQRSICGGGGRGYSEEKKIAQHYSVRPNKTLAERERSRIIHLKKLNNWIKSVLIDLHVRRGDRVIDLACGKGGDLKKWSIAKAGYYVGVDIAQGSIEDCLARYNQSNSGSFPARLICADCYEAPLDEHLSGDAPFDICSCQFALHCSWSTEARARRALANVSALLRPGGTFIGTMPDADVIIGRLREADGLEFGNGVYRIAFDPEHAGKSFPASSSPFGVRYEFHLEDAVDCPEWLVPLRHFRSLAEEYGLELVLVRNFEDVVTDYSQVPMYSQLMQKLLGGGPGLLSQDEWEVSCLYLAFVLRKRGPPPSQRRPSSNARRGKTFLTQGDIEFLGR